MMQKISYVISDKCSAGQRELKQRQPENNSSSIQEKRLWHDKAHKATK